MGFKIRRENMKALKISLIQKTANYKKEGMFKHVQTYPLPTPSMVRGAIHSAMGLKEYHNLSIGIQGVSDKTFINLQKIKKFDRGGKERLESAHFIIKVESEKKGEIEIGGKNGIMWVDEIPNLELILHIAFDDEELTEKAKDGVLRNLVCLGRNEDLISIDSCEIVELSLVTSSRNTKIKNDMYVIRNEKSNSIGIEYDLPFYYKETGLTGRERLQKKREFTKVPVTYVKRNSSISKDLLMNDGKDLVCMLDIQDF
jgi:CRISPR-associated protein Cas5t